MSLKISVQPATEPVTLDDAKLHLRVDGTDEDVLIQSYITAARVYCEGIQNRAFVTQTWELWLDSFPGTDIIEIPLPPLQSISSIKYYDASNVEATFAAASYFVDVKSEPGRVCLNDGYSWPSTTLRAINGVCVTFVAGYGADVLVPQSVKQAILLLVSHFYEHRESVTDKPLTDVPMAVDALLGMERVWPI